MERITTSCHRNAPERLGTRQVTAVHSPRAATRPRKGPIRAPVPTSTLGPWPLLPPLTAHAPIPEHPIAPPVREQPSHPQTRHGMRPVLASARLRTKPPAESPIGVAFGGRSGMRGAMTSGSVSPAAGSADARCRRRRTGPPASRLASDDLFIPNYRPDGCRGPSGCLTGYAFLDDHSRAVVGHRWGSAEDTVRLAAPLRPALAARLRGRRRPQPSLDPASYPSAAASLRLRWTEEKKDQAIRTTPTRPVMTSWISYWMVTSRITARAPIA